MERCISKGELVAMVDGGWLDFLSVLLLLLQQMLSILYGVFGILGMTVIPYTLM
eukprot:m.95912 g.95912  ORF g.95912 m.95912 type:complete len:54 (+) comp16624_c0_seq1:1-162(+)